jgi:hypothetical protein
MKVGWIPMAWHSAGFNGNDVVTLKLIPLERTNADWN